MQPCSPPLFALAGLVLAGGAPAALQTQAPAPALDLETVLERARAATGLADERPADLAWSCRGQARHLGLEGSFQLAFDAHGRHRLEVDTPLPDGLAHDGERVWSRDFRGITSVVELEERDTGRLLPWVVTGYWLDPRAPLEMRLDEEPADEGLLALEVWLRETPLTARVELDVRTWLPRRVGVDDESGRTWWELSDWRPLAGEPADGGAEDPGAYPAEQGAGEPAEENASQPHGSWSLPWSIVERSDGVESSYRVEHVAPQVVPGAYALVEGVPDDGAFDPDVEPTVLLERVPTGHLLVHPRIDGQDVGWFILDTGAGAMCIDQAVAEDLELESVGEVQAVGMGGKETTAFRRGKRFELGPFALARPTYVVLDLAFLRQHFGRDVAGIVGYDLFVRSVVEIETATPYLAIHDPARFAAPEAAWQRLWIHGSLPCVEASFEGDRRGLFKLDTGANGTLIFHRPAVERLGLLEGRETTSSMSGGVGGMAETRMGELAWFELGGQRFERPLVGFSMAEIGALTDRYTVGNIGQELLRPFRLVLDYPGRRIAYLPLGPAPSSTGEQDG